MLPRGLSPQLDGLGTKAALRLDILAQRTQGLAPWMWLPSGQLPGACPLGLGLFLQGLCGYPTCLADVAEKHDDRVC